MVHMTSPLCLCSVLSVSQSSLRPVVEGCDDGHWISQLHPEHFLSFCRQQSVKGPRVVPSHLRLQAHCLDAELPVPGPLRQALQEAFCDLSPNISQFPCFIFFYLLLKETSTGSSFTASFCPIRLCFF